MTKLKEEEVENNIKKMIKWYVFHLAFSFILTFLGMKLNMKELYLPLVLFGFYFFMIVHFSAMAFLKKDDSDELSTEKKLERVEDAINESWRRLKKTSPLIWLICGKK